MIKNVLLYLLFLIAGLIFVFSAYLKLFPIEMLEFAIADTGIFSWSFSAILARFLIGFEFLLGILLICKLLPRYTLALSLLTLVFFTFYLIYLWIFRGNDGNCNCFGIQLAMTPLQSILKNLILIAILAFLFFKSKFKPPRKAFIIISVIVVILCIAVPYIMMPLRASSVSANREVGSTLDLNPLYDADYEHIPSLELRESKWLVMFASAGCHHCINAGYKLTVLKRQIPELPVYFFINGDEDEISHYHMLTNSAHIPYSIMMKEKILYYTHGRLPEIYLIENQIIKGNDNYYDLDEKELTKWLSE